MQPRVSADARWGGRASVQRGTQDKGGHRLAGRPVCRPPDTWLHPAPHLALPKAKQQVPEVPPESWYCQSGLRP